ncbi:MAG: translation initiation factor IF-2 [Firmicutes bacterium]|nr:translation initiation factor IF-2 [Bacillota bacterium]
MSKVRVYELARELDLESKILVDFLVELGADVRNHMSTIDEDIADLVREHYSPDEESVIPVKVLPDEEVPRQRKVKRRVVEEEVEKSYPKKNKKDRRHRPQSGRNHSVQQQAQAEKTVITIPDPITVKDLAQKLSVSGPDLIKRLMKIGVMASLTQTIAYDVAELVCAEFNVEVKPEQDLAEQVFAEVVDSPETLVPRPPVVTIMGHVDHGKTTLLDSIRKTKVVATEAGGITQHIGAYQVTYKGKDITFLDTPGHEAFTAMRSRGAKVTDIAVLVVAANDGVMPQTVEAINHAKAAGVPIIVAINKMDLASANPDRVKQELAEHGLIVEEWGGSTITVPVSALRGEGIDELLEMILLVAEMEELKANPNRAARGTVIEAKLDKGRGPVATVLISSGTLKIGDPFVVGNVSGRVRALISDTGDNLKEAGPSTPVEVLGISDVPAAGDQLVVVDSEHVAREVASIRQAKLRDTKLSKTSRVSLEDLYERIKEGEVKELNLIIKGDVQGSVEAVRASLEKLSTDEVRVRVIHQAVGAISESDVHLAATSDAVIIGFNVRPEPNARKEAEREGVDIRLYRVIYDLLDDVKAAMSGLLEPEYKEVVLGRAEVRQTFRVPNIGTVAGCYVQDGKITRTAEVRVLRDNVVVYEGKIGSLRRFKDDVREVMHGYECGIGLEKFNDIKEGDVIEAFYMEKIERSL